MKIVMVTAAGERTFSPGQAALLRSAGDVTFQVGTASLTPAQLGPLLEGAEIAGITPRVAPWLGPAYIAAFPPSMRALAVFASGTDYIDLDVLATREIALLNLPDYSADSVAEHTICLILTMARRSHLSRDRVMGRVPAGTSVRGWEAGGKTLGLIGVGRIGSRVCRMAQAIGMRVIAHDPHARPIEGMELTDLDDLLARADVVSLNRPTAWGADALLDATRLAQLKPTATVVNTARMALVDEGAVVEAIAAGRLRGYAVDDIIQDRERAHRLLEEGRIVETGHTAWYSQEALDRGLQTWVENVASFAHGVPENVVALPAASTAWSGAARRAW